MIWLLLILYAYVGVIFGPILALLWISYGNHLNEKDDYGRAMIDRQVEIKRQAQERLEKETELRLWKEARDKRLAEEANIANGTVEQS